MVCPLTCGCTSTSANPWYKARGEGHGSNWLDMQIEFTVNSLEQGIFDLLPADFAKLFFPPQGLFLESGFSSRQVTAQGCPTKCSEIREAGLSQLTTCADTADEAFDWDPRAWSGTWV